MKQDSLLHIIKDAVRDTCRIWREELTLVLKDEGVLIFFVIVPLIYPLLYSWIYNNEAYIIMRRFVRFLLWLSTTAILL